MALTSKERAKLRVDAHHLEPALHVGPGGMSPAIVQSLEEAFRTRELVKIQLSRNADATPRAAAGALAGAAGAEVVQVIGRTTTLFRENAALRAKAAARGQR
ncbi:MAG TPA: YhbY family RNA-binding protein [Gemmatimonadaceae bacterium]|jgi:RNA-binding protein